MKKSFSLLSDLHGNLSINVDPCDFLLISGDILPLGVDQDIDASAQWLEYMWIPWLKKQPATNIVFIAGNHDFYFQVSSSPIEKWGDNVTYLNSESVTIDGVSFYGSPWTPWFWGWAFNLPRNDAQTTIDHWNQIPDDTQILLTHGPPAEILSRNNTGEDCGCPHLFNRVSDLRHLRLHLFGHIHDNFGSKQINNTMFVNAAYGYRGEKEKRPSTAPMIEIDF